MVTQTMANKKTTKKPENGNGAHGSPSVPKGAVERERFTERLPVKIDDKQIAESANALAAIVREQEALDEKRRAFLAKCRKDQSSIKDRQKTLAETVENGTELQDVVCVDYLLPTNEVQTVRLDTGEVIEKRAAEASDLQETLPVNGDEALDEALL